MGRAIVFLQAAVNIAWCRALCILKTEHLGIIGQCVLGAKPKRTGAKNYKRSPILLLLLPSASLPVFLGGFLRHWRHVLLIHEADKRRASELRPDSWHMNAAHICGSVCLQTTTPPPHLIPVRKWPRFSRLLDVFTYTERWWHCQSESIALSCEEWGAFYCNQSAYPPPVMMK